jgi:hypothetical protein
MERLTSQFVSIAIGIVHQHMMNDIMTDANPQPMDPEKLLCAKISIDAEVNVKDPTATLIGEIIRILAVLRRCFLT